MAKLLKTILPWELSPLQLVSIQAFCVGASLILYISIANALFLHSYGVQFLPIVFLIAAVVVPTISFAFNKLSQRMSLGKLILATISSTVGLFLATWLFNLLFAWDWVAMGMMVSFFFVATYLLLVQGMQASRFFDTRELKVKSTTILTASMAGVLLFGLTSRVWSAVLGNEVHLLLVAAILLIVMLAFAAIAVESYPAEFGKRQNALEEPQKPVSVAQLWGRPFVKQVFIYQFLSTLGSLLVLYVFLRQANLFFQTSPENMMPFFANFLAIGQVLAGGLLILIIRPLLQRIGLKFGLVTNPIGVLVLIAILLIVTPLFPDRVSLIFWLAAIAMAVDVVFSFSATSPTIRTIYQIIPADERTSVKNAIEGVSLPLALAFAGITLLPFSMMRRFDRFEILIYIILVCVLWMISGRKTFQKYSETLQERLTRRMLDEVNLTLDNAETFSRVEGLIGTGNPPLIRLALNLLQQDKHPTYFSRLIGLLNYRNEHILSDVLNRIEDEKLPNLYVTMSKLFERHKSNRIKGQLLTTISACNPAESNRFVQEFISDPDPDIQKGSLVGLIKYGDVPGSLNAGNRLEELQTDPAKESQMFTAAVLEEIAAPAYYQPVQNQLKHPDVEVRNGGLRAATTVINELLLSSIIENLENQNTRSAAMSALLAHGEHLVPVAPGWLSIRNHDIGRQAKSRIARVLGKINTAETLQILTDNISHPDIVVRSAILNALRNSRYTAESADESALIDEQILAELLDAVQVVANQRDIGDGPEMVRLNNALQIELTDIRNRIFNLLTFIYDRRTVWNAHTRIGSSDERERNIALETLDIVLSEKHNQQISAVIDTQALPEARIEKLRRWLAVPNGQTAEVRLRSIINSDQSRVWTKACAIYAAGRMGLDQLISEIRVRPNIDSDLIHETAGWAVNKFSNEPSSDRSEDKYMLTIEKVAILKSAGIFKDTPENVLASVASIVKEVPLEPHQTFIKQGDSAEEMYLVVEGEVEAVIDGKSIITLGQGQTVGELGIFNQAPRSADVRTLTDVLLFSIEGEALSEVMADRPEIAQGIIGALSRRIREQGRLMSQS